MLPEFVKDNSSGDKPSWLYGIENHHQVLFFTQIAAILWPSKQIRDVGMKKTMEDPRLKSDINPMPFDGKRMIYGGFNIVVDVQ